VRAAVWPFAVRVHGYDLQDLKKAFAFFAVACGEPALIVRRYCGGLFFIRCHVCVSLCVFVCVCVLQRQQQEADSEDEKDGEDFAEGFEVVHGSSVVGIVGGCERVNALDELDPLREPIAGLHEANDGRLADPPLNHLLTVNKADKPMGGRCLRD
jgi:hypothetical protein